MKNSIFRIWKKALGVGALLFLMVSLYSTAVYAGGAANWTGDLDTNWENAGNWSGGTGVGGLPADGQDILIDQANTYTGVSAHPTIAINSTFSPALVEVFEGAILTIQADLTTTDDLNIDKKGGADSTRVDMSAGTLTVNGDKSVKIKNDAIYNLTGGTMNLMKNLEVDQGTFNMDESAGTSAVTLNIDSNNKGILKVKCGGNFNALFNMDAGTFTINAGESPKEIEMDGKGEGAAHNATIDISGGTFINHGATRFKDDEADSTLITISGGNVTFVGIVEDNPGNGGKINFYISGGTVIFQDDLIMDGATDRFRQSGTGTIIFQNAKFWANAGVFVSSNDTVIFDGATQLMEATGSWQFHHLTINNGDSLGQINPPNINIGGSWTNNGGLFWESTNQVTFNGTGVQNLTNVATTDSLFYDLAIDKPSGYVSLEGNAVVQNTLTMTRGNIDCNADTLMLGIDTGTIGALGHTSGTIIGNFRRWIDSAGTWLFPVGTSANYNPDSVIINATGFNNGSLVVRFDPSDPGSSGLPVPDPPSSLNITDQFPEGFWNQVAMNSLASNDYDITLTGNGFTTYTVAGATRTIKRLNGGGVWFMEGTHVAASNGTARRNTYITPITAQFGLGQTDCPIPSVTISGATEVCLNDTETYTTDLTSSSLQPYTPTADFNTFDGIYDLTKINDGDENVGTIWGPASPSPIELTLTFPSAVILDSARIRGGQWDGDINIPDSVMLYNGTSAGTLLLNSAVPPFMAGVSLQNVIPNTVYTLVIYTSNSYTSIRELEVYGTSDTLAWTVTNGTITSGQGTGSINVDWDVSAGTGTVKVKETNMCGNDADSPISTVTIHTLPTSAITGSTSVCSGSDVVYSVTETPGYTYTWTITGGTELGSTTDSATVTWGIAGVGDVQVVADSGSCPAAAAVNLATTIGGYVSSTVAQPIVTTVSQYTFDAEILRIEIVHSGATCDSAAQFNFDTDGGSGDGTSAPLNNIGTAKLYATGNSATFATGNLFGATGSPNGKFSITGSEILLDGTNYFWLAYDIPFNASTGDTVDAQLDSVMLNTTWRSDMATSAPAGYREIVGAAFYHSIGGGGNWNTNGTWAITDNGANCNCVPIGSGIVFIDTGDVVTLDVELRNNAIEHLLIQDSALLNWTFGELWMDYSLVTEGAGRFEIGDKLEVGKSGTSGNATFRGTGSSTSSDKMTFRYDLDVGPNCTLTETGVQDVNVKGSLIVDGILAHNGTSNKKIKVDGTDKFISGVGIISSTSGTGDHKLEIKKGKTILAGTDLTINCIAGFDQTGAEVITNNGEVEFNFDVEMVMNAPVWTQGANSIVKFGGDFINSGSFTLNASANGNIVEYDGAANQTIFTPSSSQYWHLTQSGSNTKTLAANINIDGNDSIQTGATFATGGNTITIAGHWVNNGGAFTHGSSLVTFDGASADQNITSNANAFYNITFNNTAAAGSDDILPLDALDADNTLTITDGDLNANSIDITVGGHWVNAGTGSFTHGSSNCVTFNGGGADQNITVRGFSFWDINFNNTAGAGSDDILLQELLDVDNDLTITDGDLNANSFDINVKRHWLNTGTGSFTHSSANSVTFDGTGADQNITSGGSSFWDVTLNNTGGIGLDDILLLSTFDVNGDLLFTDGDLNANGSEITLAGDWTITADGSFTHGGGNGVTLDGAALQTLSGATTNPFNNLIVNNTTAANAIALNSEIVVENIFKLKDGHMTTTTANVLTLTSTATVSLSATPQDSSFVKGPMRHAVDVAAVVTKVFPIGKENIYKRVDLIVDQNVATSTYYRAEEFEASAFALGFTYPGTIDTVSFSRYYQIDQSIPTVLDSAQVKIYYDTNDNVLDYANLAVAKDDGLGNWIDLSGTATATASGNILSDTFTTFSKFALADKIGGGNPLPIELLYFDAELIEDVVEVTWTTETEINNELFTVERSEDGLDFEFLTYVKGGGTTYSVRDYSIIDANPLYGTSYYRLRQTDYDGTSKTFPMVTVEYEGARDMSIAVYPNPTQGKFWVDIKGGEGEEVLVVVRDMLGKEHYSKIIVLEDNGHTLGIDPYNKLSAGVYMIIGSSNNKLYSKKLVIR